jgi:ferredoxin-NADP reductase
VKHLWITNNVILIGAGSGIAPFLSLLEEVMLQDKGENHSYKFESAYLIFVARSGEQVSWVSNYLSHMLNSDCMLPELKFQIYITMEK